MAIVKYGALITEVKGSVGGSTFQGGRSAPIMRNKPLSAVIQSRLKPTESGQPNDLVQNQLNFATCVKNWGSMSQANRDSWSDLLGTWLFSDKFGDPYNGTPFQIQTAANLNRLILETSLLSAAPTYQAAEDVGVSFGDYSVSGTFNRTQSITPSSTQRAVSFVSQPLNPTAPVSKARFRKFAAVDQVGAGTVNLYAAFNAFFGTDPPIGSVFYINGWYCVAAYPYKQFEQVFKINVVA